MGAGFSPRRRIVLAVSAFALAASAERPAAAEGRLKLDLDIPLTTVAAHPQKFHPRLMLRTEQRFRDQGLVYFKLFAGIRGDLSRSLMFQTYYAHKDLMYAGHREKHVLVADLIPHRRFGRLTLADRNGAEWHITDGFFRYRNKLIAKIDTGISWLDLWLAEELRFDFDQGRLNMVDIQAGVVVHPIPALRVLLYYDRELKRRSLRRWRKTDVIAVFLAVRLGSGGEEPRPVDHS